MDAESFIIDFSQVGAPVWCTVCDKKVTYWEPTCELCGNPFHRYTCGVVVVDDRGDESSYCYACQVWGSMIAPW